MIILNGKDVTPEHKNKTLTIVVSGDPAAKSVTKVVGLMIVKDSKGIWQAIRGSEVKAKAPDLETLEDYLDKKYMKPGQRWQGFCDIQRFVDPA